VKRERSFAMRHESNEKASSLRVTVEACEWELQDGIVGNK
jgi:hypothetical protein